MNALYPTTRRLISQEAAWNRRQSMFGPRAETPAIADKFPSSFTPRVSEILSRYTFRPYEYRTVYPNGVCVQASR